MDSPKYNRTFHLPWSPGATNDDKIAISVDSLIGVPIVITEKMDGSNVSLEMAGCFARTHSGAPSHPSFDRLKVLHAGVKFIIPEDVQLFGEWCYAKHSIEYNELPSYFMLFGVRYLKETEENIWGHWDDVVMWSGDLGVATVPVLFEGIVKSEKELQQLTESLMIEPSACGGIREGIVVRRWEKFEDDKFPISVMKCVRANHVQTTEHWKDQEIIKNKLKMT